MDHLIDTPHLRPGYRLHRMEVFNWGTFDSTDGRIHYFEPQGRTTLLVGHNGSGKSTLVDAMLTLLVDSKTRNYNVAAGAKKTERTAKSYIKGAFSRTTDESQSTVSRFLRPKGNHLSAISAVFRDEHLNKAFTITQILFLKSDSDDKIYGIADDERDLKSVLTGLTTSDNVREHLSKRGYKTTRIYVEYQDWLMRRTSMRSKAIDMFNQTVHVKDIQSLNEFIRKHMLEPHDWREKVQRLLTHFEDLSRAHAELVRARRAEELLIPIEKLGAKYQQQAGTVKQLELQLESAATFFAVRSIELLEPEIEKLGVQISESNELVDRLDADLVTVRESIRQLRNEIEEAGGDRLKLIPELIKVEDAHLVRKNANASRFHEQLRICGIGKVADNLESFESVRKILSECQKEAVSRLSQFRSNYEEHIGAKAGVSRELEFERKELEGLERRRTNLPSHLLAIRSQICGDLNLDESVLPFAAELISVVPKERRWESSLEMVIRPFAVSLLVPNRLYTRVRAYVERHRLVNRSGEGQRLDYLCVGQTREVGGDRIDPRSAYMKLQFKPNHDLTPWVKHELLKRYDFICCESDEEFNDIPRMAITANRHVKYNAERHQKDDREKVSDPRYFVLGWDNTEKKRLLIQQISKLEADLSNLNERAAKAESEVKGLEGVSRAATDALKLSDFDDIDVKRHESEIRSLLKEKNELESSNDAVKSLRKRLDSAERSERSTSSKRDEAIASRGRLGRELETATRWLEDATQEYEAAKASQQLLIHQEMFAGIQESLGEEPIAIETIHQRKEHWRKDTERKLHEARKPLEELGSKVVSRMSSYLNEFREHSTDIDADLASIESFKGLLEQLRHEGLPKYEKKFKDRLNDEVSKEIGLFSSELRQECKRIQDKIEQLNQALASVAYNKGSKMRLQPRLVQDGDIEQFRRSLNECLDEALEHSDAANEARFLRIQSLVQRLADKERVTWRNKVIDVRNWFDFAAQEIDEQSGVVKSSYDGSSGQSGGEKAKLAFTILVAALAYQYDVDPNSASPGRFQFVVVDEMFSKVDDHNANYALQLFKQFGLQLLIVAPLDAKARITEPFVDRYLHTVKDAESSKSQLYSMTAQEYEEVAKSFV